MGVHFAGRELGSISSLTGIPFLSSEGREWVQARTGQTISSDKLSPARAPWEKERGQTSDTLFLNLGNQNLFDLPNYDILRRYFEAYKGSLVMQRIFPVIDTDLFEETIISAYQQPRTSFGFGQASTRACIIAFLAFVARLPPVKTQISPSDASLVDHDTLATKAQFLLTQVLQEPANLDGAQAVTMLVSLIGSANGSLNAY